MTPSNDQPSQALDMVIPKKYEDLCRRAVQHLYGRPVKSLFDELPQVKELLDPIYEFMKGGDLSSFTTLISDLMTWPPNEQHSRAKLLFNLCKQRYPNIVCIKLQSLLESGHLEVREMSVTLFQNLIKQIDKSFWNSLSEFNRSQVKNCLLKCAAKEENKSIIKILADIISELAANNGWPELIPFMLDRVVSDDFWSQESALLVFARLQEHILSPHITRLHGVFMRCIGNVGSVDVRIAALIVAINCIQCLKTLSDRVRFEDLLPGMMQSLEIKVLNNGDEVMADEVLNNGDKVTAQEVLNDGDEALNLLIELAKNEPGFFKGHLVVVVEHMLRIAEVQSLQVRTRHLAIEFVITLVEARESVPEMMRELLQFISSLFAILIRMLLDIKEEAAWHLAETSCRQSNYSVGQECLHRLANALGGNTIVSVLYDELSQYLAVPDHEWQKHLAALVALAQIAKGCSKVMIPNLEQVVIMVLNSFQDRRPRVRWAAISAIGELSTYVDPSLLDKYQDCVLKALLASARDDVNTQVQAHAIYVMLHFSSHSPGLDGIILKKLIELPPTHPIIRVLKLANSLEESTDVQKRAILAVQLRKMFEEPLAAPLGLVQRKLLTCVKKERDRIVTKHLCHTIATFFNVLCIKTGWSELFDSVERWALGDNDLLKEAAILILGPLGFFMKNHPIFMKVYCACLENGSPDIKIAAFDAAIGYIRCTQVLTRDVDVGLVRAMTQVLNGGRSVINICKKPRFFINAPSLKKACSLFFIIFRKCTWSNCTPVTTQEATTQEALKLLIKWAHQMSESDCTELLRQFVRSAIEIAQSQSLKKETRHFAIDFVITLGEGRLSNCDHMIDELFEILMLVIENEAGLYWESRNFSVLREFLHRLAFKLDKKSVAWPVLKRYLAATEWQKCVAGIIALAPISNVLKVRLAAINATATGELSTDLDSNLHLQFIPALADLISNNNLDRRVRVAAINASRDLSTDLDAELLSWYHVFVLPALGEVICDFEYPQIQEHAEQAASALIKFSEEYPQDALPFLRETVGTLLEIHGREDIVWKDFARHKTRSGAIKELLRQFEWNLPRDTWESIIRYGPA